MVRLSRPKLLTATTLAAAATLTATGGVSPAQAVTSSQRFIVHVGGCSGAVLNTRSGTWVITAAHCGRVTTVRTMTGRTFHVTQRLVYGGPNVTGDVMLVQVDGRVKSAVSGGFALGTTPPAGSRVNVYGYPSYSSNLAGCSGLVVSMVNGRWPQVDHCYLPTGTSGGPWYTNDVVLRGVVGGLNNGGSSNYITNTIPFTSSVLSWAWSIAR